MTARRANAAFDLVMVLGWCAALWLALGVVIGEDRDALARSLWHDGRDLAEWVGIRDEPEVVVVSDPVPTPTP